MILYPSELKRISAAVEMVQKFVEEFQNIYDYGEDVNFELPECMTVKVYDVNGEEMGWIDWTEHGNIGFISKDHVEANSEG